MSKLTFEEKVAYLNDGDVVRATFEHKKSGVRYVVEGPLSYSSGQLLTMTGQVVQTGPLKTRPGPGLVAVKVLRKNRPAGGGPYLEITEEPQELGATFVLQDLRGIIVQRRPGEGDLASGWYLYGHTPTGWCVSGTRTWVQVLGQHPRRLTREESLRVLVGMPL